MLLFSTLGWIDYLSNERWFHVAGPFFFLLPFGLGSSVGWGLGAACNFECCEKGLID